MNLRSIIKQVADRYELAPEDLTGRSLAPGIARVRQEAMYLARETRLANGLPRWSLPQIGAAFGRDHSTILHGVRAHAKRVGEGA